MEAILGPDLSPVGIVAVIDVLLQELMLDAVAIPAGTTA